MTSTLARSYAYCERLARREAGNFYPAFRVLPGPERRSMCALYAFLRVADDLTDGDQPIADKQAALAEWRSQFARALAGEHKHPLHEALQHTVQVHTVPRQYLEAVLDGVEMDLLHKSYATFDDLYLYCYRVASAVGLSCIHIWGFSDERATLYAEKAGIAFQLTNILRDLREDAARDRVYLPQEDLKRFEYSRDELFQGRRNAHFHDLMRFQAERAREYYVASEPLLALLAPAGRAVFRIMLGTYRGLLEAIVERDYDVFSSRVSLSRWRKLSLVVRAMPARWGWT